MDDWKSRIDKYQKRQEDIRREKAEREAQRRQQEMDKELAREKREEEKRLKEHQSRFKCHICGEPSAGPWINESWSGGDGGSYVYTTHWETPTELMKCSLCGKWTCSKHIHSEICASCARKLP